MFYTLHRIYVLSWVTLAIGGLVWLYPRTGVSEPLLAWYEVWQNGPGPALKPAAELSGTVVRVMDGATVMLRTPERQFFNIGLLGIVTPAVRANSPAPEFELAERSTAQLSDLVLSNDVHVVLTWLDAQRRGVGVVHLGETNVNAAMVASGLVKLKRAFIKGLPVRDQYALIRADRKAKERKRDVFN